VRLIEDAFLAAIAIVHQRKARSPYMAVSPSDAGFTAA